MTLTNPYYHKLLPDQMENRKTLVINLNKTLICYEYKLGKGFQILKRPGLNKFLQDMSNYYEIVIFGTEDSGFVEDVCSKLDAYDITIKYKLGNEATRLIKGKYVKDLRLLNRNLKNVICIDYDPENVKFTPFNTVIIPEYAGNVKDKELLPLVPFLMEMAKPNVKDVRNELEKYGNFRPHMKFYKANSKYHRMLPKETSTVLDDEDIKAIQKK